MNMKKEFPSLKHASKKRKQNSYQRVKEQISIKISAEATVPNCKRE